jgi:hypothetical protein
LTYSDGSSSLYAWPMAASFLDEWIWAWQAQIRVNDFFQKIDFRVLVGNNRYQKETFCISEVVSVGSTDTYNFLPTDTKNCFHSIV